MDSQTDASGKPAGYKGTVLIVDDTPENLFILNSILTENGYLVRPALNGRLALEAAQVETPDIILLDIKMPDMDGFETCARLRADERTKEVPIIFVSALTDVADKVKGLKVGAVDYVTKPFEMAEILARVETQLTIQKLQKQLKEKNRELEEASRLRSEAEHIIYHDLKGPLSPIISFPKIIRKIGSLTKRQAKYLNIIEKAAFQLLQIIGSTNDLFKMEMGIYHFHPEYVNLLPIMEDIITRLQSKTNTNGVSVLVLLNGTSAIQNDSFLICGQELLCYSMLYNLIRNAVEASTEGQKITISLKREQTNQITIHNEAAIPAEFRAKFFEKYTTLDKKNGTGLGTYSAKLAAETQKANITMKSSEEKGTAVIIDFPG